MDSLVRIVGYQGLTRDLRRIFFLYSSSSDKTPPPSEERAEAVRAMDLIRHEETIARLLLFRKQMS
ncbi:MAG TPA: hypothetical protein VEH77_00590, partial [Roseiarcus sp.]|nr:hypothetical protein [Roseiarcus sp.]